MSKAHAKPTLDLEKLTAGLAKVRRYSFVIFLVVVAAIYGFVLLRITTLSNMQPSDDAVNSQVEAAQTPHIDEKVVGQLKSLQDNSVNVKSLFDQTRSNPFQ